MFRDERRRHVLYGRQVRLPRGANAFRHRSFLFPLRFSVVIRTAAPPPSTCSVEPLMKLERGELRNSTASAIADACTMRPNGNARPSSSLVSPHPAATPSVRVGPGADTVDLHSSRSEFRCPGTGQRFQGCLGGAVSGGAGNSLERIQRWHDTAPRIGRGGLQCWTTMTSPGTRRHKPSAYRRSRCNAAARTGWLKP